MTPDDQHAQLFKRLYEDRVLAHRILFNHRHSSRTQAFHEAMIRDWHNVGVPRLLEMAFRGSAKSTIAEEALTLLAGFREFKNGLLIGETYDRACERLHTIRHEMETNEKLQEVFGSLVGPTWSDGEIVTSAGVRLLAIGRGQALRGTKFEDMRPDAVFCHEKGTPVFDGEVWAPVENHKSFSGFQTREGRSVALWGLPFSETVTPEHRYWTRTFQTKVHGPCGEAGWCEADDLTLKHYVGTPIDMRVNPVPAVPVWRRRISQRGKDGRVTGGAVYGWETENLAYMQDPEFWWVAGLWWGDGHVAGSNQVAFTCADKYPEIKHRLEKFLVSLGKRFTWVQRDGCSQLFCSWADINRWLRTWKVGNSRKAPPTWVERLDPRYQEKLLDGYVDSDGCRTEDGVRITSIHLDGLLAVRRIAARLGKAASIRLGAGERIEKMPGGRVCRTQQKYDIRWSSRQGRYAFNRTHIRDGVLWNKVRSIECAGEREFAPIQTESHTYLTHFGLSHNCDDIENNESVADEKRIMKVRRWFFGELLPACDVNALVRVAATPLAPDALAVRLINARGWKAKVYPIEYLDQNGERKASWADRYPLSWIDAKRDELAEQGMIDDFEREYLCQIIRKGEHTFSEYPMTVEPQVRTWQAVYAMFDPARTVNKGSATTGFASWSWTGADRLVIWDSWARKLLPDEIVSAMFDVGLNHDLPPVWIGVEEDGLNEFLLQPIRSEQARRGQSIPFRAIRAPKGKLDFIRGLQPYFRAGRVSFAKECPDLMAQLRRFPSGAIDAPNALAYALRLRPGAPIHDHFSARHVVEDMGAIGGAPPFLVVGAERNLLTGALCHVRDGALYVREDWVREGSPAEHMPDMVAAAQMTAGRKVTVSCEPKHFDWASNVGVTQACTKIPVAVQRSGTSVEGQPVLARLFQKELRGFPAVQVSTNARWTLNGLAGGYARGLKNGVLTLDAEPGPYRTLLEAIEGFAALTDAGMFAEEDELFYATTASGARHLSARR